MLKILRYAYSNASPILTIRKTSRFGGEKKLNLVQKIEFGANN
jgi:hypothetical protein